MQRAAREPPICPQVLVFEASLEFLWVPCDPWCVEGNTPNFAIGVVYVVIGVVATQIQF
jgi:hypothetical protein